MKVAGARFTLSVIVVAAVSVLAACGGSSSSGSLNNGGGGPDEIAITCTGPLATPGAAPSAAPGSCAPSLGGQVAHADCASAADIGKIDGFQVGELNTQTGSETDQKVAASIRAGHCDFIVPGGYVALMQAEQPIQDGLTIVDFIPRSGQNSVGLLLRCPQVGNTPCLGVYMYSSEAYECVEVVDGKEHTLTRGTFAGQQFPAPQLEVNQPNRLVLDVKGGAVHGYINGRQICGGKTAVPLTPAGATVQIAQAGGSAPAGVDIIDFYVFAAT
ncbi:MAG TPA: hypothetical protein VF990_06510 [Candidatus Dormibacteraeota bacterium]